jgi:hypothetical protein
MRPAASLSLDAASRAGGLVTALATVGASGAKDYEPGCWSTAGFLRFHLRGRVST